MGEVGPRAWAAAEGEGLAAVEAGVAARVGRGVGGHHGAGLVEGVGDAELGERLHAPPRARSSCERSSRGGCSTKTRSRLARVRATNCTHSSPRMASGVLA